MPGGGEPLHFRYAVRSESRDAQPTAEFITGWLKEIGIATTQKIYDDGQLTEVIGKGDYDMFDWGWAPYVDPDTMLFYFTCDQIAPDPEDPTNYYNDANRCDNEYDRLYKQQKVELDPEKRIEIVHEMLTRFDAPAVYDALYTSPTCRRTGRTGSRAGMRQPAEIGPGAVLEHLADLRDPEGVGGVERRRGGGGGRRRRRRRQRRPDRRHRARADRRSRRAVAWAVMRRRTADERE